MIPRVSSPQVVLCSPCPNSLSSDPVNLGHFCASLGHTGPYGCSCSGLRALGRPREPCKAIITHTAQVNHSTVLLFSWAPEKQGHRWGSCCLIAATISTLQSSDVQGVLLVLPNPEFWPEDSTGLSASFSVSNSLSYIPPLHLSSAQFSLLDLPKFLYLLARGTECTFPLSGSLM